MKKDLDDLPPDDPEVFDARLTELEHKMDRLRNMYESYFMGTERRPPNTPRMEMNRLILELQQVNIRKALLRFRFRTLMQRWSVNITYWNRTMREIEAGTYRKDVARAQRHMAERGEPLNEDQAIALGIPAARARAFIAQYNRKLAGRATGNASVNQAPPPPEPGTPAPAQPSGPVLPAPSPSAHPDLPAASASAPRPDTIPGMTEGDVQALCARYAEAQRQTGDLRGPVTPSALKEMLGKQAVRIMREHAATGVKFDVAIKDGRVVLRAKPLR